LIDAFNFLITFLLFCKTIIAQDEPYVFKPKREFLVTVSYLYNTFIGERKFEYKNIKPSTTSVGPIGYLTSYKITNTSGVRLQASLRRFYTDKISIQQGINFTYKTGKYIHNDSARNKNNSPLLIYKNIISTLNYSFYFNYHIKKFSFSSGLICPLISFNSFSYTYKDKSIERDIYGWSWGTFYISESIGYRPFSNPNILINLGADIAPSIIYPKENGYKILLNAGISWVFEKNS
jgi:hypothetical protein